jgi:hypothetical protein
MSSPEALSASEPAPPPRQRFTLTVQPATPQRPWRAWLQPEEGPLLSFASPIELLRHLAQLGPARPPPGALK